MAQTGFTPISNYYSATATNVPTAGNLVAGELAINTADGKLFYKDSSGVVQTMASKATGSIGGSTGQMQYNNAGTLAGSGTYWDSTNGRLGVGTSTPGRTLEVYSSGPAIKLNNGTYNWTVGTGGFIDGTDTLVFYSGTAGDTVGRFNANGNLVLKGGTVAATGVGVTFPATQSASSDANCLDDYEEGTWTGTLTSSPTPPSSPPTATGYYTKIGNLVTVFIRFTNVNTTGASGEMYIAGLPFTSASPTENNSSAPMMYGLSVPALYTVGYVGGNSTNINFLGVANNGAWATVNLTAGSSKYLNMSISYRTA